MKKEKRKITALIFLIVLLLLSLKFIANIKDESFIIRGTYTSDDIIAYSFTFEENNKVIFFNGLNQTFESGTYENIETDEIIIDIKSFRDTKIVFKDNKLLIRKNNSVKEFTKTSEIPIILSDYKKNN
ncbi:MAG: hypothetical protein ACQERJ_10245 [Bacillota bacterium]